jgi:hypothetical protein
MKLLLETIDEEEGWKLLERKTINDRTLICWYNPDTNIVSLCLFHLTERPNELSKRSPESTWGFATAYVTGMYTLKEASEVVSLYLQDMEADRFWWENLG